MNDGFIYEELAQEHFLNIYTVICNTVIMSKGGCLHYGVRKTLEGGSCLRNMFSVFDLLAKGCTCS